MLKRHGVLPSRLKVDRGWCHAIKLVGIVVGALVAAYLVNAPLL